MVSEPLKKSKWRSTVKKLQALSKRLENKKLLMSQKNSNDHKIWVDVQVERNRLLQAMVDSEATNNYILQQAIRMLGLTLQWALKPMQVYMVNEEFKWITNQVHIKAIILEDSQELTFDVLNLIKYDAILEMPWLRKKNSRIDWISKELYTTIDVYKIPEQPEMSLSEHKSWDHEISLLDDKQPRWMPLYSMSKDQLKKVRTYLEENLKRGFIRPSKSSAEYLILFVSKKNDTKWLCVNYRQLNKITRWDSYSLLLIRELQDRLSRVKWFTSLNLKEAYYQVQMKEGKEWKTVFWTRYRHYKYTVMLFELKNTPTTFQRLINDMLREYLDDFTITYLNDILIYSDDLEMHCSHVHKVLRKLNKRALYVKKSKSKFEAKEIKFLDYVIQSEQIKKNLKKTDAVRNWPSPKWVKKVQAFLRLTNYYQKFISNYARIAESLTQLMRKNKKWHWDMKQKDAFHALKKSLSRTAHLRILNSTCKKVLKTDASNFAVGACLYQIKDGQKRPIAYRSRKLSELEKRYEVHDKELLVIVKALQDWRPYLTDTEKPIQIYTDHKNLRNFATTKQLNQWQVCWAKQLADYEFQIHYKKGNENGEADALSRQPDHKEVKKIHVKILSEDDKEILTKGLAATYRVKQALLTDKELIQVCHNSRASGHLEVKRIEDLIWRRHNISDLRDQITEYIAKCNSCCRNKIQRDKRYDRVTQLDILNVPWESITMNFITKLPTSKNLTWEVKFDSILTIVDRLTKYTMFIPFKKTTTAPVLMYTILQELVNNHELSKKFITDRDKLFTSKFWETLTAELRINHKMLMAYHSQTNEQSKQMNQMVKMYLRHYVNKNQNNWVQLLLTAQFVYNNTQNETTEETPFQVNYEYNPKVWQELQAHKSQSQKVILDIIEIKKLHRDLANRIQQQLKRMTEVKPFMIEERVYLRTNNIHVKQRSKKLNNKSIKPFKIKRNIKKLSYELDLLKEMRIHPVFHAFMLQCCNQFIPLQITEMSVELDEEYQVENILEKRMISGKTHYLIKWKGYNTSENTWELIETLNSCARTLQHFERGRRQD